MKKQTEKKVEQMLKDLGGLAKVLDDETIDWLLVGTNVEAAKNICRSGAEAAVQNAARIQGYPLPTSQQFLDAIEAADRAIDGAHQQDRQVTKGHILTIVDCLTVVRPS
jgi:hypothetical protein